MYVRIQIPNNLKWVGERVSCESEYKLNCKLESNVLIVNPSTY
jgi:hypothetical protein